MLTAVKSTHLYYGFCDIIKQADTLLTGEIINYETFISGMKTD